MILTYNFLICFWDDIEMVKTAEHSTCQSLALYCKELHHSSKQFVPGSVNYLQATQPFKFHMKTHYYSENRRYVNTQCHTLKCKKLSKKQNKKTKQQHIVTALWFLKVISTNQSGIQDTSKGMGAQQHIDNVTSNGRVCKGK